MLRRTVLSTLALLSLTSTAFGGVIWSSAGYISGQYTAVVHENEFNSDGQFVNKSDLNLAGECGQSLYGEHWLIESSCGSTSTGGDTYLGLSAGNLDLAWGHATGESELIVFGSLLVPGTGSAGIQFDMLYHFMVGGASSGWADVLTPILSLGGSHVPIAVDVKWLGENPSYETAGGLFAGKATATIERGTPLLFSISYKSELEGYFGHPSPSITTDFNLVGIKEVQAASPVPEPASIAITAVGLLALAAWKSRRRRGEALRSV